MLTLDPMTTISAPDAARAGGGSLFSLKNYIRRELMLFPGVEGRPGHGRPMNLWGAYEFAVLTELQREGLSLEAARAVWFKIVADLLENEGDVRRCVSLVAKDFETATVPPLSIYLAYGMQNDCPKALPAFMSGNVHSGILLAVAVDLGIAADGNPSMFNRVGINEFDARAAQTFDDFSALFTTQNGAQKNVRFMPRHGLHLFNLNSLIFNVNMRLTGTASEPDAG